MTLSTILIIVAVAAVFLFVTLSRIHQKEVRETEIINRRYMQGGDLHNPRWNGVQLGSTPVEEA